MRAGMNQKRAMMWHSGRVLMALLALICLVGTLPVPAAHATGVVQVTFTVKQLFINNSISAPPNEVFTYQLSPQTPDAPMPPGSDVEHHTFTIRGTSDVEIGPINFDTPGLYVYTLSCATGDMPGYSLNWKMYTIEVYISDKLEASVIYIGDEAKVEELAFERTFEAQSDDPVITADLPVRKTVNGNPVAASTFTFRLTAENTANPMPAGSANGTKTVTVIGTGQAQFGTWTYTSAGTYRYTVSEINGGIVGYTYDTTVYTITDEVAAADGRLVVTRSITSSAGGTVSQLRFVNTYTSPSEPNPPGSGGGSTGKPNPPVDGPKTGDFSNPALWISLIAGSCMLLVLIIWFGWRRRKK